MNHGDVRVQKAECEKKKAKGDDSSGLIIATFENRDQVSKVLEAKNDLRKTNDYRAVYIEPYLNQTELSAQTIFGY